MIMLALIILFHLAIFFLKHYLGLHCIGSKLPLLHSVLVVSATGDVTAVQGVPDWRPLLHSVLVVSAAGDATAVQGVPDWRPLLHSVLVVSAAGDVTAVQGVPDWRPLLHSVLVVSAAGDATAVQGVPDWRAAGHRPRRQGSRHRRSQNCEDCFSLRRRSRAKCPKQPTIVNLSC